MVQNKLPKLIFLAYLIPALMGSSAFSTGKALCFEHLNNDSITSGGYFSSMDHTFDWLAGEVHIKRKTGSYSNSMLQDRLFSVFALTGIIAITVFFVGKNLKIINNLVLLKLRI
jgi:hypothetical protein